MVSTPLKRLSARQKLALPPMPDSPTLSRQTVVRKVKDARPSTPPRVGTSAFKPLVTPPARPSTPPRKASLNSHQLSAMRTPLSHLGVHMSPSPSLAHYKSHLNPPPAVPLPSSSTAPDGERDRGRIAVDAENVRTPTRRRTSSNYTSFTPATPRKLAFTLGGASESPFRGIFDPHDPSALLDEELARLGAQGGSLQESPAGLFARGRGLLYESPDGASPGKWSRMW